MFVLPALVAAVKGSIVDRVREARHTRQARRGAGSNKGGSAPRSDARPIQAREKHAVERASRGPPPPDRDHARHCDPDLRARRKQPLASDRIRRLAPAARMLDPSEFSSVLARYVAEAANANNREQVRSVEITIDSATFSDRVILVDTPGVGSTFLHNSRTAETVLSDCDVGFRPPDPPITEVELGYLDNVQRLVPKVYFALNKVDILSPDERDVALTFLANVLEDKLGPGRAPRIFPVSAKTALSAKREADATALAASGLPELEEALANELTSEERAIAFATGRRERCRSWESSCIAASLSTRPS